MASVPLCLLLLLPQASTAEVDDLLRKLDADRFAERTAATQKLTEMGSSVFGDLAKAATESDSREVQERALKILRDHFREGEESLRNAAERTLGEIAKHDSQVGRQAAEILRPEPEKLAEAQALQQMQIRQLQMAQIQARVAANRAQIQIQAANGRPVANRRIQVSTNGRKIKIEVENGKIKMEIETTDQNGKKETKKYEAADEAELKKKHPEAYKEYERYAGGGRAAVIRPANVVPAKPAVPEATRQRILDTLKRSEEMLEKETEKLKQSLKGDDLDRALKSLERRRESLKKARERYEKPQQPAEAEAKAEAKAATGAKVQLQIEFR